MIISGLQKTTLLDYPGHVSATIFTGGCNFRCPFCHNMNIAEGLKEEYSEDEILEFLKKRAGILDGVCITGGEPTINAELPDFIDKIKKIDGPDGKKYLIKLDTNGTNPEMLKSLIDNRYIDYAAMDIKTSVSNYAEVAGISDYILKDTLIENVKKSVKILIGSDIECEFRTTIVKEYHNESVMHEIGELIKGADKYFIQSFIDSEFVPNHTLNASDKDTLMKYQDIMKEYVNSVEIRGVD